MADPAPRLRFFHALGSLYRAVGTLWRAPRILLWLMPPLLITLLLDGIAFSFAFDGIRDGVGTFLPESGILSWLRPVFNTLGAIALLFVLGWSFAWLLLTLASPFQDYISAAVEKERQGFAGPEPPGFKGFFRSISQSIVQAVFFSLLTLVFLVLGFIPLVGPALLFLWTSFALGYSFIAIPSGRMAHRISQRLSFARRHLGAVMGLGAAITAASLIPIVNILLMPIFVVAGTLLYLDAQISPPPQLIVR